MTQPAVTVRVAGPGDLPALLDLYRQLADDRPESLPGPPDVAGPVLAEILAEPGRALIVAVAAGAVVGTADMVVVANLTHGAHPWVIVENVVVDETVRGTGVGKALMAEVVDRARAAGAYKIQLLSRTHRTEAHAFYRSLGFGSSAVGFRRYLD